MNILVKKSFSNRLKSRLAKKVRIRKKISGTLVKPRLCVYRSLSAIYVQLIDDTSGKTVLSASTSEINERGSLKMRAEILGKIIAEKAKAVKITEVVFDRNGFIYHGRVKALADSARANGLNF